MNACVIVAVEDQFGSPQAVQPQLNCMVHGPHLFELDILAAMTCGNSNAEDILGCRKEIRLIKDIASHAKLPRRIRPNVPSGTAVQITQ